MVLAFTAAEYREMIRHFAQRVPQLLASHPGTAPLALDVERLNIKETLDGRFTVAVVGQMRVGKSTLLNALMGRDLAPTGVNETTATINWFRYGEGALCERFRVHWADGTSDDQPLGAINEWLGDGAQVARTRQLDFFAATEFLRTANLVDTPGTRSTLDAHEGATRGFVLDDDRMLAAQEATHHSGSKADAVLYVLNPVARETDRDMLGMFGDKTRMAGASIHNSLAAVQKWENLGEDALGAAFEKCARIQQQLDGKVALVMPTSGLMANHAARLPAEIWSQLVLLAQTSAQDFADLTESADFFREPDSTFGDVPVLQGARKALSEKAAWPVVRFALREARRHKFATGEQLRNSIHEASGIDRLRRVLAERFFAQAELIKANTVLRRAWDPCAVGLARLRTAEEDRRVDLDSSRACSRVLDSAVMDESARAILKAYVVRSRAAVESDLAAVVRLRGDLDDVRDAARANYEALDGDMRMIEALSDLPRGMDEGERGRLRHLLGLYGTELHTRLMLPGDASLAARVAQAEALLQRWQRLSVRGATHADLYQHACDRLSAMLDVFDSLSQ